MKITEISPNTAKKTILIVKMQLSIASNTYKRGVLVYDEANTVRYEAEADAGVLNFMKGRDKVYAYVERVGTELVILREAPIQDW